MNQDETETLRLENERLRLELEKADAENDRLAKMFADECYIESAHMTPGFYDINVRGKGAMILCGQLLQMFRETGGKNFITNTFQMEFGDPKTFETFELTIQKVRGEDSPAMALQRKAEEISRLRIALDYIMKYAREHGTDSQERVLDVIANTAEAALGTVIIK